MTSEIHRLSEYLTRKRTLYFTCKAGEVFIRGKNLVRRPPSGKEDVVSIKDIRRLVLIGKPQIGLPVLYKLMREGIHVDWLDTFGRPLGQLLSLDAVSDLNIFRQNNFTADKGSLELARSILLAKFDNGRDLLRRRVHFTPQWNSCRRAVLTAPSAGHLRGAEGMAARLYFSAWTDLTGEFTWCGRRAHPAPDPVNMLLSLGYGLLHNRFSSALRNAGLDPRIGFFHSMRGRHCALASDLMEPLRYVIDSVILRLIRRRQIKPQNFSIRNSRCVISDKKTFSLILHKFEEMFACERKYYFKENDVWDITRCSINDLLDDMAEQYVRRISFQSSFSPPRVRPCQDM